MRNYSKCYYDFNISRIGGKNLISHFIITHPGKAHLDDFLSCCLVLYKDKKVKKIVRKEPTEEEIKNPKIWKLDVGNDFNPDLRLFDHHQRDMRDNTFSLLLKEWDIWEKANEVYSWIPSMVLMDIRGSKEVVRDLDITYEALNSLDSFIERYFLRWFKTKKKITRSEVFFKLMRKFGEHFFTRIKKYFKIQELVEREGKYKMIEGIPVIILLSRKISNSNVLHQLASQKRRQVWPNERAGILVFPNDRPEGSIGVKRLGNDRRIDLYRLHDFDKTIFAHKRGFFAALEKMSDYELEQYIKEAIVT
ncbi:MAG: MYG1 family protein [Promethearchaeia archaeon]